MAHFATVSEIGSGEFKGYTLLNNLDGSKTGEKIFKAVALPFAIVAEALSCQRAKNTLLLIDSWPVFRTGSKNVMTTLQGWYKILNTLRPLEVRVN